MIIFIEIILIGEEGREVDRKKFTHVKKDGKSPPGSPKNPINFSGEAAGRSELLSNNSKYSPESFVLVEERMVYRITGRAKEVSGTYAYCYPAKPFGFI